ncbi:MAG: threonine/homoserine/homoserine lactone efflux protein, partial [Arcobacteraceae bacterium]
MENFIMDINLISIFITVAIAHFLALLSPGPDFVLILKSAIKNNPKAALGVVLGITSANALYITLCLIGIGSILASSIYIMIGLKILGGLFLMYLALQSLLAKKSSYAELSIKNIKTEIVNVNFWKEFITGFMSAILNPKNLLFYLSLFTLILTKDVNLTFKIILAVWMTTVVFLWDSVIIFILSKDK